MDILNLFSICFGRKYPNETAIPTSYSLNHFGSQELIDFLSLGASYCIILFS